MSNIIFFRAKLLSQSSADELCYVSVISCNKFNNNLEEGKKRIPCSSKFVIIENAIIIIAVQDSRPSRSKFYNSGLGNCKTAQITCSLKTALLI